MKKKCTGSIALLLGGLIMSAPAWAEDWSLTVAPSVDIAFKRSSYKFSGAAAGAISTDPSYTSLAPSIAIGYGPIYWVMSYDTQTGLYQTSDGGSGGFQTNTYDRSEASMTVGYRVLRNLNVFLGYVSGNSTQTEVMYTGVLLTPDPTTYKFHEQGAYLGGSYSMQFGDRGALLVSAAYGKMNGRLDLFSTGLPALFDSSAPGYSVGLSWSGPLTGSMVYRAGFKYTQYNFNIETAQIGPVIIPLTNPIDIKEEIMAFTIGVANYF